MGTMIQAHRLDEAGYRGERFRDHPVDLKGNNDLLSITRPDIIASIHREYLEAGADIVETNTFNANAVSMADYGMEPLVHELNVSAARVARAAVDAFEAANPGRPRFVAGAIGPTNRTLSLAIDVNRPGFREKRFGDFVAAYSEQVRGLLDGGVDLLLVETIFDTLVAKAALFAIEETFERAGRRVPVMVSGTITDRSGRTLSGQMIEAFWNSVSHVDLLSVGINCALGAREMRPYVEELSRIAPVRISAYPNAGLPNAFGGFDETPEKMARDLADFAENGWVNVVGGCCGTTPAHIAAIARAVAPFSPRPLPSVEPFTRLSGLEPLTIRPDSNFIVIGERTNVTGSPKFAKLVLAGKLEEALAVARQQVDGGANILDVNMDEGLLDSEAAMREFLNLVASEPEISRLPIMIDSSKWSVIEAGLQCLQGKCVVNSISLKEGEDAFRRQAKLVRRYGAAVVVMAFDERGQADTADRKVEVCTRAYQDPDGGSRVSAGGHRLRPEHPDRRDRDRRAQRLRGRLPRSGAENQGRAPALQGERRGQQHLLLVPRQQRRPRGDALRFSLPRDPRGARHGDRQRGPARGVRGDFAGPPGARGRRSSRPPARRDGTPRRVRRVGEAEGERRRFGGRVAQGERRGTPRARAREGHRRPHRRGHRRGQAKARPAAVGHRGSADGRNERRRRSLRQRQDVSSAGRQERARDEESGRVPPAVSGSREVFFGEPENRRQSSSRDGQGRRARHREEHRGSRARLQQLRGARPRRDGRERPDPEDGEGRERRPDRPLGADHAVARRDGPRGPRDGARGPSNSAADRRRDDEPPPHGGEDRSRVFAARRARVGRVARRPGRRRAPGRAIRGRVLRGELAQAVGRARALPEPGGKAAPFDRRGAEAAGADRLAAGGSPDSRRSRAPARPAKFRSRSSCR